MEYGTVELVREIKILKDMTSECILRIKDVVPVYNKELEKRKVDSQQTVDSSSSSINNMGLQELYIIMELADTDLRKLTQSSVYLDDGQVRKMLYQIL